MQLAVLFVVVCAISGAGTGAPPPGGILWRLVAALAFLAAAPLAALAFPRADRRPGANVQRRLADWQTLVTCVWTVGCLAVLYIARLPEIVRSASFTLAWPLVDDLLILAPLVASLNLVWVITHRTERAIRRDLDPADAPRPLALRSYLELRWRHYLGLTILPALVILGLQESAAALKLTSGVGDARAWWLWAALVVAAVFALPLLLRGVWRTQRVADSPLKQRLLDACHRIGCPVRDIVVWRTGGTVANAAVAGLLPRWRTIFLSDALLERLSDDEIDVVVRHEAAHLAQRHLWQRLALLLAPVALYAIVGAHWPGALAALQERLAAVGIAPAMQVSLLLPAAALAYALLVLGWLARLHEHDADLAACCAAAESEPQRSSAGETAIDSRAVEHLRSALCKLVGESREYDRRRWFHPSVIERVEFLLAICRRPVLAPRFRARLGLLFFGLLAVCLTAVAAGLWSA
jgi:Zn-dependent protease with chaperone function